MTSLDFRRLLREEKAKHHAERLRKNTSLAAASQGDDAETAQSQGIRSVGMSDHNKDDINIQRTTTDDRKGSPSSLCLMELTNRPSLDTTKIRVGTIRTIFYAPNFVSEGEAQQIISRLYTAQAHTSDTRHAEPLAWVGLRSRRLLCLGGQPGEHFRQEPLPDWVQTLCDTLVERGAFTPEERPNHVLINEYQPGQGIMPHTDGPYYEPRTATLSLGSDAIMNFSPRIAAGDIGKRGVENRAHSSVVLREYSLVIFTEDAYKHFLHGIDPISEENVGANGAPIMNVSAADAPCGTVIQRRLRISLTFRRVAQVQNESPEL